MSETSRRRSAGACRSAVTRSTPGSRANTGSKSGSGAKWRRRCPGRSPRASNTAIARWRGCERQRGQIPPQPEIRRIDILRKRPPQQGHSRPPPRSSSALTRAFASAAAYSARASRWWRRTHSIALASQTAVRSRSVGPSKTGRPSALAGGALATGADPAEQLHHPARLGMGPRGDPRQDRTADPLPGAHHAPLHRIARPAESDVAGLVELDPDVGGRLAARVVAEVEVRLVDSVDPDAAQQSQVEVVVRRVGVALVERRCLREELAAEDDRRRGDEGAEVEVLPPAEARRDQGPEDLTVLVHVVDRPEDRPGQRVAIQMLECTVHRLRDIGVVGVDPGDQIAPGEPQALVDRLGLPAVRLREPGQVRVLASLEQLDGPIVGCTVDDDVLMRHAQRGDAVERLGQEARHVARGGDDREHRHRRGRLDRGTAYIGAPVADRHDAQPYRPRVEGTTKRALITGISGQDGSYLAELLLEKGYEVHGIIRRSSSFNTGRIEHLFKDVHDKSARLFLHYGDLADASCLEKLLDKIEPTEVYNLGAQSHVRVSFDEPIYTADIVGLGALRILEAIKNVGATKDIRYYQASSSEMYGLVQQVPQTEKTPFYPRSPYGCA